MFMGVIGTSPESDVLRELEGRRVLVTGLTASLGFDWEGICPYDSKKLLACILVWKDIAHREKGLPLMFAERINLLADGYQ